MPHIKRKIIVDNWVIKLSKSIGYLIIAMTGFVYIFQFITLPMDKAINICLTAFVTTGSLSAICYTAFPCVKSLKEQKPFSYAAEKFLHSSLLIIQSLFLKYAAEGILSIDLIKNNGWIQKIIGAVVAIVLMFISVTAIVFSALGFDELNKFLWTRYEKRKEVPFGPTSQNYR